jgi:hypothetical protein
MAIGLDVVVDIAVDLEVGIDIDRVVTPNGCSRSRV